MTLLTQTSPADQSAPDYPDQPLDAHDARMTYFIRGEADQNFGDYLPALMACTILGAPRVEADLYLLVGSVISPSHVRFLLDRTDAARGRGVTAFWGCGARDPAPLPDDVRDLWHFFGVRGPLTRDALGLDKDTPLGDPGLLAPLYHRPYRDPAQADAILIPHTNDPKSTEQLLSETGAERLVHPRVAGTEKGLRDLLDTIASARFVLTGSLHGAIIACAYKTPFAFLDTGHVDVPFKWRDFAASVGIEADFVSTLAEGEEMWRDKIEPALSRPPMTPILDCCPFHVSTSARLQALVHDGLLDAETADRVSALTADWPSETRAGIDAARAVSQKTREGAYALDGYTRRIKRRVKKVIR